MERSVEENIANIINDAKRFGSNEEAIEYLNEQIDLLTAQIGNIKDKLFIDIITDKERAEREERISKLQMALMNTVKARDYFEKNVNLTSDRKKGQKRGGLHKDTSNSGKKGSRLPKTSSNSDRVKPRETDKINPKANNRRESTKMEKGKNNRKDEAIEVLKKIGTKLFGAAKFVWKNGKNIINSIISFAEGFLSESKFDLNSKKDKQAVEQKKIQNGVRTQNGAKSAVASKRNLFEEDVRWIHGEIKKDPRPGQLRYLRGIFAREKENLDKETFNPENKVANIMGREQISKLPGLKDYQTVLYARTAKSIIKLAQKDGIEINDSDGKRRPVSEIYDELAQKMALRFSARKVAENTRKSAEKSNGKRKKAVSSQFAK